MKSERNRRKLNQQKLASLVGISKSDLENIENGKGQRNLNYEKKIKKYFLENPYEESSDSENE